MSAASSGTARSSSCGAPSLSTKIHSSVDHVSGEDRCHPTEDGVASRNTSMAPVHDDPAALRVRRPATEGPADLWPGGYEHPRSHSNVRINTYSSHVGSRDNSTCASFGIVDCKCCKARPAIVGMAGVCFSYAKAGNCNSAAVTRGYSPSAMRGDDMSAKANRVGPEGKCDRKGAIAISVRLEAKKDRRMLRLVEANVGTEDNVLNILFAHLSRQFPDVALKRKRKIDRRKCEKSRDASTDLS